MNTENHISDEMLAAYLDGNATPEESAIIRDALDGDELLEEVVDVVNDVHSYDGDIDWTILDGSYEPADGTVAVEVSVDAHADVALADAQADDVCPDVLAEAVCPDVLADGLAVDETAHEHVGIEMDDLAKDAGLSDYGTDDMLDFSVL
jgi:hypothetical protein